MLSAACASGSSTSDEAERLVRALNRQQLPAIAVREPGSEGRLVAARPFGRRQLTVLAGPANTPEVEAWLTAGQHLELYRWLLTRPSSEDAVVIHDLNGLGLRAERATGEGFDMVTLGDGTHTAFDGDWTIQQLTHDEYCVRFKRAEQTYASLLHTLLTAVQRDGASP